MLCEIYRFIPSLVLRNLYIPLHLCEFCIKSLITWCANSNYSLACCAKSLHSLARCAKSIYSLALACCANSIYFLACYANSVHSVACWAKSKYSLACCENSLHVVQNLRGAVKNNPDNINISTIIIIRGCIKKMN